MANFTGTLRTNEVFASIYNQIISLQVFDTGVEISGGIYASRKVDGTLLGDTKLFVSTDVLKSYAWKQEQDVAGYNLLTAKRPPLPKEQYITLDVFRQIPVTVDDYLTKRAFAEEGTFMTMNGVFLSWLGKTKEIYEHTQYTTDIVIGAGQNAKLLATIDLDTTITGYDKLKYQGQELFRQLEDNIKELSEPSRAYNDLSFMRTAKLEDFDIVVPLGVLSNIRKHDVPFLFNEDTKPLVKEIHWKYFGTIITTGKTAEGTERSLLEKDYTVSSVTTHVFPSDLIPVGATIVANEAYTPKYTVKPTIQNGVDIFLIHKSDLPIMSAFSVNTSFFNAHTLTTNQYLTFGHNNVLQAHLCEYPMLKLTISIT